MALATREAWGKKKQPALVWTDKGRPAWWCASMISTLWSLTPENLKFEASRGHIGCKHVLNTHIHPCTHTHTHACTIQGMKIIHMK